MLEVEENGGLHIETNRYYPILARDNITISFSARIEGNISSLRVGLGFTDKNRKIIGKIIRPLDMHNNTWWNYNLTIMAPNFSNDKMLFRIAIDAYAGEGGGTVYIDNVVCRIKTKLRLIDITYTDPRMILDNHTKKLLDRLIVMHGNLMILSIPLTILQVFLIMPDYLVRPSRGESQIKRKFG